MSKLLKAGILCVVFGLMLGVAGFSSLRMFINGRTINLADPIEDFDEKALSEGEISFVYGPFATLETTHKTYGVTTSKSETDYFIVSDINSPDGGYVVFSTSDSALRAKLTSASDQWYDYFSDERISEDEYPIIAIPYKGKVWDMNQDPDFQQFYSEARADLRNIGIEEYEYAQMVVVEGEVGFGEIAVFILGVVLFIAGLLMIILPIVKGRKKDETSEDFYY